MINSKMNGIMVRIRVLIEDQEGKELTRLQSMNFSRWKSLDLMRPRSATAVAVLPN
jgi:hypothetical protein